MCFSPSVSLFVFIVELILAAIVLLKNPKKGFNRLTALILFLLGLYQLGEFLICRSGNPLLWAKLARLFYAFLPALGVHWAYKLKNGKKDIGWIYLFPAIFALIELSIPNFVTATACIDCMVKINCAWTPVQFFSYSIYYFSFISAAIAILLDAFTKEKNKIKKRVLFFGLASFLVFSIPAFVLLIIFPKFYAFFPSLYCEFALLFAMMVFYTLDLKEKHG